MNRTDHLPETEAQRIRPVDRRRDDRVRLQAVWYREVLAGAVASIATLAVVLTLGLLSFAPLGGQASSLGITAAFV